MTETMPSAPTALQRQGTTAPCALLVPRRVVDARIEAAAPGEFVLLEAPAGSGKRSALAASEAASRAVVVQADAIDDDAIDELGRTAAAAGNVVVLMATGRAARMRLLASGRSPVLVGTDDLRFDLRELADAAERADVRLSRSQLARALRLTAGRPALVARLLGALPRRSSTTDASLESAWADVAADARARVVAHTGAERWRRLTPFLRAAPIVTTPMRRYLASLDSGAEELLDTLEAQGLVAPTDRFGETVSAVIPVFSGGSIDPGWRALVQDEYARIGADLELATQLADDEDWDGLRILVRARYAELLLHGARFAFILSRVPSTVMAADGWLIVVERMLAEQLGTFAPVRRPRKPASALPSHDRAWLQASKVQLELESGAFRKAVAEASYLARLLEQSADHDGTTADLWMHSALPAFFTGGHQEAIRRSSVAIGLAVHNSRRHVELFSGGVVALAHALRGDVARAGTTVDELAAGSAVSGFEDTHWTVPARIATALVLVERGEPSTAARILDDLEVNRLGPFWAAHSLAVARIALAGGCRGAASGLDRLRLIEQFAGGVAVSNRHRGLLAGMTALLHLSLGNPGDAAAELRPFDDGRESSLLPSALIHLARADAESALTLAERGSTRNSAPATLVAATTVRIIACSEPDPDAVARRDYLARECGLERFSALIEEIGAR